MARRKTGFGNEKIGLHKVRAKKCRYFGVTAIAEVANPLRNLFLALRRGLNGKSVFGVGDSSPFSPTERKSKGDESPTPNSTLQTDS